MDKLHNPQSFAVLKLLNGKQGLRFDLKFVSTTRFHQTVLF